MPRATRTFRIFVSSTFAPSLQLWRTGRGMQAERNTLQKYVFPRPFDCAQGRSAEVVCAAWVPVSGHRSALGCARRGGA
jgi:hypothetical protein